MVLVWREDLTQKYPRAVTELSESRCTGQKGPSSIPEEGKIFGRPLSSEA